MSKTLSPNKRISMRLKIIVGLVITIPLFIAGVVYYVTGFGYTVSRIRCGNKPFVKVGSFEPTQTYIGPNDPMYKYHSSNPGSKYYCSERDAQDDGLYRK